MIWTKTEVKEYLISAYVSSNDFQGALEYLKESSSDDNEVYHKVAFLYANQLFKKQDYTQAIENFNLSVETSTNSNYKARSIFWKAESLYRLQKYEEALQSFQSFMELPTAKETKEYDIVLYHIAYTHFQLKDYNQAGGYFNEFLEKGNDEKLKTDSFLRLGDCFFCFKQLF